MKNLSRADLLKKEVLEIVKVDLGKGEFVYVTQMTGHDRDKFERSVLKRVQKGNEITFEQSLDDFRAKLAVCTVCDEKGKLLFQPEDAPKLSRSMSAARLELIVEEAQRLNKITEEDKKELVKN